MPRLSLYKPEKGNDFKFIDQQIYEMFQVGGTDVFIHKYLGPVDPSDPNKALDPTTIQDVLLLENRDRKYDTTVYPIRGVYNVQDIDFNLSQFGLFLQNDTIFLTIHINNSVDTLGRKIISGDVIELPHLIDPYALGNLAFALKRFYVVEDINRAAEGFSMTWWPHLYRLKCKPLTDSPEFKDILNIPVNADMFAGDFDATKHYCPGVIVRYNGQLYEVIAESDSSLNVPPDTNFFRLLNPNEVTGSGLSDYLTILAINNSVVAQAEADAPKSGFETQQFWTLSVDRDSGQVDLLTVDQTNIAIDDSDTTDETMVSPDKDGYQGYLVGDGIPPNGAPYGFGIQFPAGAALGDYFLRTDYYPNRLFRFDGKHWIAFEDNVRMTMTNNDQRQTQRTSFINNTQLSGVGLLNIDVFTVADPMVFRPTDPTLSLNLITNTIVTKDTYNTMYGVEMFQNENRNPVTSTFNEGGKLAFTFQYSLAVGDRIQWSLYEQTVQQRQAVSKALRPRADF